MEVLRRHHHHHHDDAPMDLSVGAAATRTPYGLWQMHSGGLITLDDFATPGSPLSPAASPSPSSPSAPPSPPSPQRYIPIPKKRHCHARSPPPTYPSTSTVISSPVTSRSPPVSVITPPATAVVLPSSPLFTFPSPVITNKRPRVESPDFPSAPSAKRATHLQELTTNSTKYIKSEVNSTVVSPVSGRRPVTAVSGGEGRDRPTGATISSSSSSYNVGSSPVDHAQSLLAGHRGDISSAAAAALSPTPLGPLPLPPLPLSPILGSAVTSTMDEDHARLLSNILQMQQASSEPDLPGLFPPTEIKDPEVILKAMQQSQMLYYSYCTQLIHTLKAKQEESLQHEARKQESSRRQQVHERLQERASRLQESHLYQETSYHPHEFRPEHLHEMKQEISKHFRQESSPVHHHLNVVESDEEDLQIDDDYDSDSEATAATCSSTAMPELFRARLHSQDGSQSRSSPSPSSPSGMSVGYPSSTTGPLDDDLQEGSSHCSGGGAGRKRAPRALTGKHVRPGTGASPTTLLTLRQKLQMKLQKPQAGDSSRR
ncbi:unnamed protein product [Meganyctiphanes norvegica]|uniref:Uncharacterized protein n=1 Tax=Meganyctiphanes norvegica TaxID=48144 RepID=A0AAV2SI82_MEGNR